MTTGNQEHTGGDPSGGTGPADAQQAQTSKAGSGGSTTGSTASGGGGGVGTGSGGGPAGKAGGGGDAVGGEGGRHEQGGGEKAGGPPEGEGGSTTPGKINGGKGGGTGRRDAGVAAGGKDVPEDDFDAASLPLGACRPNLTLKVGGPTQPRVDPLGRSAVCVAIGFAAEDAGLQGWGCNDVVEQRHLTVNGKATKCGAMGLSPLEDGYLYFHVDAIYVSPDASGDTPYTGEIHWF